MNFDPNRTVRDFATEMPNATRIFEKLGIDYCCGGGKSLREACAQARIPLDEVLRTLEQGAPAQQPGKPDFAQAKLAELVDHIITKHHAYVQQEIPRIQQLAKKVLAVHGAHHPELARIQIAFQALSAELTSHMMKEEHVLFPYIAELEGAVTQGRDVHTPPFGTVNNPVHMMEMEHESAGALLREIRAASAEYTAPPEACFSYKTLYSALQEFEADLHQHIHLENNILFPRAIEMERQTANAL
jgi:regulator of cell morphogenesis and NO signaling